MPPANVSCSTAAANWCWSSSCRGGKKGPRAEGCAARSAHRSPLTASDFRGLRTKGRGLYSFFHSPLPRTYLKICCARRLARRRCSDSSFTTSKLRVLRSGGAQSVLARDDFEIGSTSLHQQRSDPLGLRPSGSSGKVIKTQRGRAEALALEDQLPATPGGLRSTSAACPCRCARV